ncbi:MAG: FmdB family transcriptional regulator [Acidimicrobiales bacterium]|nr:FmdB family transcriptional regulator [Acidimicrobiales bacterium]
MPTYEYRCKDCDHQFEIVQSFSDESLRECPECGGTLKKVFGNVGIAFKGGGFYKTDSRTGSSSGGAKASDSSSSSSSKESNGSSNGSSSEGSKSSSDSTSSKTPAAAKAD